MDEELAFRGAQASLDLRGLEGRLGCGQFRLARGELCGKPGKLGIEMISQVLNGLLEPVIGGDLLCLADLYGLEVGQDDLGEQLGEGSKRVSHEEILSRMNYKRMITAGGALVTGGDGSIRKGCHGVLKRGGSYFC